MVGFALGTSRYPRATPDSDFVGFNAVKNERNAVPIACSSYRNRQVRLSAATSDAIMNRFGDGAAESPRPQI
jgi:hypothetical protein